MPLTNIYVPGNGLMTFLGLAAAEALRWKLTTSMNSNVAPNERARAVSALRKVLDPQLLAAGLLSSEASNTNRFFIPSDEIDQSVEQNEASKLIIGSLFVAGTELFPKDSWPRTVAREAAFVLLNHARYANTELERICNSEQTGPIGFLAVAELVSYLDKQAAREVALQGLTRLSPQDFLTDCDLLLKGDSGLARSFSRLVATLRALPQDELAALVTVLPEAEANLLRESAAALRANPEATLESVLYPALSKYWEDHLRTKVRTELRGL
jgi:hypothetical protein